MYIPFQFMESENSYFNLIWGLTENLKKGILYFIAMNNICQCNNEEVAPMNFRIYRKICAAKEDVYTKGELSYV